MSPFATPYSLPQPATHKHNCECVCQSYYQLGSLVAELKPKQLTGLLTHCFCPRPLAGHFVANEIMIVGRRRRDKSQVMELDETQENCSLRKNIRRTTEGLPSNLGTFIFGSCPGNSVSPVLFPFYFFCYVVIIPQKSLFYWIIKDEWWYGCAYHLPCSQLHMICVCARPAFQLCPLLKRLRVENRM